MTATVRHIILGVGAGVLALGVTAGVYASARNTSQDPRPFRGPGGSGGPGRAGGPGGFGGPGRGMLPMLGPQLGLSDAQKDQIRNIAASHKDDWKALADRARMAHEALKDAVTADAFDETLIRSRGAEAAVVDADIAVARARARADVFQILTAEQKAQVKTMRMEMKNRMKGRQDARRERRRRLLERFGL